MNEQRIIQFPGTAVYEPPIRKKPEPPKEPEKKVAVIEVMPWEPMPEGYPDYRRFLQRDGLILLSWSVWEEDQDIRVDWIASTGSLRRYSSCRWGPIDERELGNDVMPERRFDIGRDRFDKKPDFIVYAAPPDLTANTRAAFVQKLREVGIKVNFDYEFSIGTQKQERERVVAEKINSYTPIQSYSLADLLNISLEPFEKLVEEFYEDGSIDRWKREKEERKAKQWRGSCRYDRAAIMRSAWAYRKGEGFTMSAALKRAWAEARHIAA
jgi:hypothetical protein